MPLIGDEPGRQTELEWQELRTHARDSGWPEFRALIEAAYAQPMLRALYPFTSHWTLRFSMRTRPHLAVLGICLDARQGGTYTLQAHVTGPVLARTSTAQEIAAFAVYKLPAGLGPVTSGATPGPRRYVPPG